MMGRHLFAIVFALSTGASVLGLAACDDDSNAVKEARTPETGPSAPLPDGGPTPDGSAADGAPTDCVQNPKTHEEIINGCTDAVKITKNPVLPNLLSDGGLPPL